MKIKNIFLALIFLLSSCSSSGKIIKESKIKYDTYLAGQYFFSGVTNKKSDYTKQMKYMKDSVAKEDRARCEESYNNIEERKSYIIVPYRHYPISEDIAVKKIRCEKDKIYVYLDVNEPNYQDTASIYTIITMEIDDKITIPTTPYIIQLLVHNVVYENVFPQEHEVLDNDWDY